MRTISMLLTLLIVLGSAATGSAENVMQGFSGILWGTSIEDVRGLHETARSGDIHYYKRTEDFYSIAGVTLSELIYGFFQGQYFAAYMPLNAADDVAKVKQHLDTVYGDARAQLRINQTIYIWDFLDVKIKLKQYRDQPRSKLSFYYVPLSTKANAAKSGTGSDVIIPLDTGEPEYDF